MTRRERRFWTFARRYAMGIGIPDGTDYRMKALEAVARIEGPVSLGEIQATCDGFDAGVEVWALRRVG